jgi:hypothetical protein
MALVFWTQAFGKSELDSLDMDRQENLIEQIEIINGLKDSPILKPVFFSQDNNWKPM